MPESESIYSLFKAPPSTEERKLVGVVSDFDKSLKSIEARMAAMEQNEKWPYQILRPSMLAFIGWI